MLDHGGARHRLWLPEPEWCGTLVPALPADRLSAPRLAALSSLLALINGEPCAPVSSAKPSLFRTRRLMRMLAVLDMLAAASPDQPATTHLIARTVLFPRLTIGRGSDWKGSSERRQAQRFIAEALAMRDGGYRALLG